VTYADGHVTLLHGDALTMPGPRASLGSRARLPRQREEGEGVTHLRELTREFRRQVMAHYLAAHGGNVSATARALGVQRTYLWRLLRGCGLKGAGRRDWRRMREEQA
jgi:DNA-binding NtrC family response regulator